VLPFTPWMDTRHDEARPGRRLRTRDCRADPVMNQQRIAVTTRARTFLWLSRPDSPRSTQS
jgi:hypothetical protein